MVCVFGKRSGGWEEVEDWFNSRLGRRVVYEGTGLSILSFFMIFYRVDGVLFLSIRGFGRFVLSMKLLL